MSSYKIIPAPNEALTKPTKNIDPRNPKLHKIVSEMTATLLLQKVPQGVGLAANQVGLPYSLFLTRFSTKKGGLIRVFINPEIVEHSQEFLPEDKKLPLEGCLSLPKHYGFVKRWKWVKLRYQSTVNSEQSIEEFEGFPAIVIQHEMDHLDGKIFVQRILEQKGKLYKITGKKKDGKEVWEEVSL